MAWEVKNGKCYCNGGLSGSCSGQTHPSNCRKCCYNIMPHLAPSGTTKGLGGSEVINPASTRGFGFDTSFDGRIRGGIKTPDYINLSQKRGKVFDIFQREKETATNDYNSNAKNSITRKQKRLVRIHPLDISGASRSIGEEVYDPISNKWKIDDGRPRGYFEEETGERNWACWGKCKTRSRAGWFGGSSSARCKCERSTDRCRCDGCMDDQAC